GMEFAQDADDWNIAQRLRTEGRWILGAWVTELRLSEGWEAGAPVSTEHARAALDANWGRWGVTLEMSQARVRRSNPSGYDALRAINVRVSRRLTRSMSAFAAWGRSAGPASDDAGSPAAESISGLGATALGRRGGAGSEITTVGLTWSASK